MTTTSKFWDRIAKKYAATPVKNQAAYERTLDLVRSHLKPDDRALELGAGTASTAIALAPSVGSITATDYSAEMARIGREKAEAAGATNVTVTQAGVAEALALQGDWSVILAFNLLHLVPDLEDRLADIRAHLPEGGLFISKTPCLADMSIFLRLAIPVMRAVGYAPYVRFFRAGELDRMIESAGFAIGETHLPGAKANRMIVARAV